MGLSILLFATPTNTESLNKKGLKPFSSFWKPKGKWQD